MELPAERTKFFDESFFHEMVNVFGVSACLFEPSRIVFRAFLDLVEGNEGLLYFGCCEDANRLEGFGPSAIDCDFVGEQAAVEGKRALKSVEARVRFAFEAAAPEFGVFAIGHLFSLRKADSSLRSE